ncbi:hypothetical protein [Burkholderia cenocepacia]|uniref:hypothetical protein n=1 Tax=Burkholderia cenocepacia TaxID=95486 RepID=UPI000761B104|nr:hypothetical protein [Burkholderia cenocepacia]KWU23430.1 hypothetical protein AS149_37205 [Burkholderia cenocepacia]
MRRTDSADGLYLKQLAKSLKMTFIRTIAVGLGLAAYFILHFGENFLRWILISGQKLLAFLNILQSLSPTQAMLTGASAYQSAMLVLAALAAGLFIASIVWPPIEDAFFFCVSRAAGLLTGRRVSTSSYAITGR